MTKRQVKGQATERAKTQAKAQAKERPKGKKDPPPPRSRNTAPPAPPPPSVRDRAYVLGQHLRSWLLSPLAQQILALLLVALSIVTLLALLRLTSGRLTNDWAGLLQYMFGWGAYPAAVGIAVAGTLLLQHTLDRPVHWRWRPVLGGELALLSLLALTHLALSHGDPWTLVGAGYGGGIVGWAFSTLLLQWFNPPVSIVFLTALLAGGLFLTFDVTTDTLCTAFSPLLALGKRPARAALVDPADAESPPIIRHAVPAVSHTAHANRAAVPAVTQAPAAPVRPSTASVASAVPATGAAPPPQPASLLDMRSDALAPPQPAVDKVAMPPFELLDEYPEPGLSNAEVEEKSRIIVETLSHFGLPAEVTEVRRGPVVTQFGVTPGYIERNGPDGGARPHKVRVGQITTLSDDLALALAAPSLRVEAPVPGRSIVGIEVPNDEVGLVSLRSVLESKEFQKLQSPLAIALGKDVAGSPVVADLATMPHLLVAGTTGSGKSICIKSLATCLIFNNAPADLRLIMIDPKMVELVRFNGLPHLLGKVETELERIVKVLRWVALEMDERYKRFAAVSARHLDDFNRKMQEQPQNMLPRIVVFIDELADLMMMAPEEVERTICRLAQMARATGIHLVVATQRPSVDVVTGLIKANFPARVSFAMVSQVDSRVILDQPGAETLLGKGDMLFLAADAGHALRVQGCYVNEREVERVSGLWREQYVESLAPAPWERMIRSAAESTEGGDLDDDLVQQAVRLVQETGSASASLLQRRLRIGYPRAARLMDQLEEMGIVGPPEAAGRTRAVIIGQDE